MLQFIYILSFLPLFLDLPLSLTFILPPWGTLHLNIVSPLHVVHDNDNFLLTCLNSYGHHFLSCTMYNFIPFYHTALSFLLRNPFY